MSAARVDDADLGSVILAAGRRLASERGSAFTTQDVIKEADVALQTFYRYYGGKDQLLLALIGELIREHVADLRAATADVADPLERLERYVRTTVAAPTDSRAAGGAGRFITAEHWRLHERFPEEIARVTEPVTALVQEALDEGRRSGVVTTEQPDMDAWLITKLMMSVFHHLAFVPDDPAAPSADAVWAFCLGAVTAPRP